jgi:predicted Zn-dependent peptidase
VSTPYFTDETVQKEQGIIAQEIRMGEDNPGVRIYYNLLSMLYKSHPVKDRVAGTVESIAEITAQTLYDCHRAFYAPANMCLCVEGNVKAAQVCEIAMEVLGGEKASEPCPIFGEAEGELPVENLRREYMQVSAPQFLIGAKLSPPKAGEDKLYQRLVAQLSMRMLAGCASPFYTRLYAEGLLNRDFDYEVDFFADTGSVIIGGESTDPEKVLAELSAEVERVSAQGFDKESFELAKRASLGARLRGLEDFENVCISLVEGEFEGFDALESIPMLARVDIEDCRRFVCEKLSAERLALSIVEPGRDEL